MALLRRRVTPASQPQAAPQAPGLALSLAADTNVTALAKAARAYAEAGGPDDAPTGVRLMYAERTIIDSLNALLVGVHAALDDIHGAKGMPLMERRYHLLLDQVLCHLLPDLLAARADVVALHSGGSADAVRQAMTDEAAMLRNWIALAAQHEADHFVE